MKPYSLKIALTGAHGTGKTTLAANLSQRLQSQMSVIVTPEVPRLFIQETGDASFFKRGQNTVERQFLILMRQLEVEHLLSEVGPDLVICDRTIVDHWAYTRQLFPSRTSAPEGDLWQDFVFRWARTYDAIIRLPPEFPPVDDGVRESDLDFQSAIDRRIQELYRTIGIKLRTARGSLKERTDFCIALIMKIMSNRQHEVYRSDPLTIKKGDLSYVKSAYPSFAG